MQMNNAKELKIKWIAGRTNIISNMLDNPDDCGIYPTTKCFNALDDLHNELLNEHTQS